MKTVLITGASRGIGKATALIFLKNGWQVAATMRELEKETYLTGLKNVKCYRLDVTDPASINLAIQSVIKDFGGIDVLINNAGVYTTKPLEMVSENEIHQIIDTNIIGTISMTKAIIPYYRSRRAGLIINLSSMAGRTTFPYQSLYHGTKWAIEGISEGLMYELKKCNIGIKIIEPGMIRTDLYDRMKGLNMDHYPNEYRKSFHNWHDYLMKSYQKGNMSDMVAKTIYRAAVNHKKKLRYPSGMDTKMVFFIRSLLPFSLFKRIISCLCRL